VRYTKKSLDIGKLVVITGPMFSGKTSRLIEFLERERFAGRKVILFKPEIDKRYGEGSVKTHKGIELEATVVKTDRGGARAIFKSASDYSVIGVDEAQFWNENSGLEDILNDLASQKKIVYVSTLNKDYRGVPFSVSERLLAYADEIYSLTAVCTKCGEDAVFSQRMIDGVPESGPRIVVGGKEAYQPRCRNCYIKP
jgi:thymidine kinase